MPAGTHSAAFSCLAYLSRPVLNTNPHPARNFLAPRVGKERSKMTSETARKLPSHFSYQGMQTNVHAF